MVLKSSKCIGLLPAGAHRVSSSRMNTIPKCNEVLKSFSHSKEFETRLEIRRDIRIYISRAEGLPKRQTRRPFPEPTKFREEKNNNALESTTSSKLGRPQ